MLNKINALLLILAVILSTLLWWQPPTKSGASNEPLSALSSEQIQTITMQGLGNQPFELTRRDKEWWLTEPQQLPADPLKVDALLAMIDTRVYERFALPTGEAARQFFTEDNRHWVRFDDLLVWFGQAHPLGQRRYLSLNTDTSDGQPTHVQTGSDIALVDDFYYHHLLGSWVDWVNHQLLPPDTTLTGLALPALTLTLEQSDEQIENQQMRWHSLPAAADINELHQLVNRWQTLQATKVTALPENLDTSSLQHLLLEWQDAQGTSGTLSFYLQPLHSEAQLHHPAQRVTYHLNSATANNLFKIKLNRENP